MRVNFLHPRESTAFPADVEDTTTVQTCLDNLMHEGFIQRAPTDRPYMMVVQRTQKQALPSMTMQEADVCDNDALAILQMERGARAAVRTCDRG